MELLCLDTELRDPVCICLCASNIGRKSLCPTDAALEEALLLWCLLALLDSNGWRPDNISEPNVFSSIVCKDRQGHSGQGECNYLLFNDRSVLA